MQEAHRGEGTQELSFSSVYFRPQGCDVLCVYRHLLP